MSTHSERTIPLSDLDVDEDILAAARSALESGWWSMGPRVSQFESEFAALCGTETGVAVSSGTAALHLALLAVGCDAGSEVILPSLNFVAAANVIVHIGATPVFCDVLGAGDLTLDPVSLERATPDRTRALVVLHYAGFPCAMDPIMEIAQRHGVAVIEDAAHAPGSMWEGKACGSIGDVGCFSFFSNKNLPVGEGGMVITGSQEIAERVRLLRSHGMTTTTWDRERGHAHSYDVPMPGLNYRMDEARAAIGSVQLERLRAANAVRSERVRLYRELLAEVDGLTIPFTDRPDEDSLAHHLFVVVLPRGCSRERVRAELRRAGIETSVHYPPIHHFTYYAARLHGVELPKTDQVAPRILTLPLFPGMGESEVRTVAEALAVAVGASR